MDSSHVTGTVMHRPVSSASCSSPQCVFIYQLPSPHLQTRLGSLNTALDPLWRATQFYQSKWSIAALRQQNICWYTSLRIINAAFNSLQSWLRNIWIFPKDRERKVGNKSSLDAGFFETSYIFAYLKFLKNRWDSYNSSVLHFKKNSLTASVLNRSYSKSWKIFFWCQSSFESASFWNQN